MAAFPVELPTWAINVYSHENDIVYDPFMGIGTTAVDCINTNRHYIGSEIDENYFNKSKERIENEILRK